jgi:hypothetical protein
MEIKISHEVPLVMLEDSRQFNDYDYALVHLFKVYPEYFDFFKKSVELGRDVLLDNSIFELGKAFDSHEFAVWIQELCPTRYVIPDVLGNAGETIAKAEAWVKDYSNLPGETIGVIQGDSYEELTRCYKALDELCDQLAICFHYPYYEQTDVGRMIGRQQLIARWIDEGVINESKKHHLLGCSLPQEFVYYGDMDFIYSLDTSNPIVHGLKGITYGINGLPFKEKTKLADLIEAEIDDNQSEDIQYNIQEFKKLVNK